MKEFSFNTVGFATKILDSFKSIEFKDIFQTGSLINLEYLFGNISFIVLFIAVLLYWFDFSDTKPVTRKLKSFCMLSSNLSLTLLLLVRWWESGHFPLSNLYESLIGLAWGFTTVHLIITLDLTQIIRKNRNENKLVLAGNNNYALSRSKSSLQGTWPFASLNEANINNVRLANSALDCKSIGLDLESKAHSPFVAKKGHNDLQKNYSQESQSKLSFSLAGGSQFPLANGSINSIQQQNNEKIGAITAPTALLTSVFATFFLPPEMLKATTLIPALKSNWLTMHVTVMIISYAFLLVGSLLSIAFCAYRLVTSRSVSLVGQKNAPSLISTSNVKDQRKPNTQDQNQLSSIKAVQLNSILDTDQDKTNNIKAQLDICIWLNTTSYRILGLGFPLLTIGILSGAVWANEAWGSYWSWDPKETWALITWLVFAIYFHSRYNRSSEDSIVPASIASVGFVVIWVCYLGVNLLGKGLHSYGGFGA